MASPDVMLSTVEWDDRESRLGQALTMGHEIWIEIDIISGAWAIIVLNYYAKRVYLCPLLNLYHINWLYRAREERKLLESCWKGDHRVVVALVHDGLRRLYGQNRLAKRSFLKSLPRPRMNAARDKLPQPICKPLEELEEDLARDIEVRHCFSRNTWRYLMEAFYHESYGPGLTTRKFCPVTYGKQDYTSRAWMTAGTVLVPVGRSLRPRPTSDMRHEMRTLSSGMDPLPLKLVCWKWLRFTGVYFYPEGDTNSKHWRTPFLSPEKVLSLSDLLVGPQPRMVTMISLKRISEIMIPVRRLPKETVIRVLTTWLPRPVARIAKGQIQGRLLDRRTEIRRERESMAKGIMSTLPVWNDHCSCHCRAGAKGCQMCWQLWISKQDRFQFE